MYLAKETFEGPDYEHYTKVYNEKEQIISEKSGYSGNWRAKTYTYNEQGKLSKIFEETSEQGGYNEESKYLHVYEYNEDDYRIICYRTDRRDINDTNTYENLVLGQEIWHKVDEIISIDEYKFNNGLVTSEKHHDLRTGEHNSIIYKYDKGKKVLQLSRGSGDTVSETRFIYENDVLQRKDIFVDNAFVSKTVFVYENNLLQEEQVILTHGNTEFTAYTTKYYYNDKGDFTKSEYYGRYNSKLYLCKVSEMQKENGTITRKEFSISYHEFYTGFFDLQSLNEVKRKEFDEQSPDEFSFLNFGVQRVFEPLDERYFDNLKFDNNYCTVEVSNSKGELVERIHSNPETNEIYTRLHYHNEYNDEGKLELTICFDLTKGEVEKVSVRRLVYK